MADGTKYVVHGMRAKCSEGSMENYINTDKGHGVVYQGQPVLNANDHVKDINLTHFGDCKSKLIFEEAKKQADEKYKAEEGDGFFGKLGKGIAKFTTKTVLNVKETFASNKCELDTPLPWLFTSRDHMIDGAPALTTESQCPCKFGGIITIVQEEEVAMESEQSIKAVAKEKKKTGKDTTWFQELLDDADKSLDAWLIAHGYAGTDEYGARALWMFEDDNGIYHAKTNAWQQIGGYNYLYDKAFDYGTSMDAQFFNFTYNEREFRVWAWKGDYINLGAGAEIGIYSHTSGILGLANIESPNEDHWLVDTNLSMPMTLNLVDNEGHEISDYRPTEVQWWITSFNPAYKDVEASNLTATYTINFSGNEYDKGMYDAFREQWEGQYKNLTFDNYTVTFGFLGR
ncbi:protein of unknown function [Anaerocolumna jejuensis DSM 15929]|uniref:DUF4474 domain-containing protein n=1 Tax=Anaerocolumna jejuensis DSM 15929 TaxID=1121322 RepID=A0A1M6Y3P5_9FIRM|nr:PAAR-like protein [Anaerocolumna jejuensis]SHL12857.1 protein of unknown function [Anaerocolumna jejuensis DSM 15929]